MKKLEPTHFVSWKSGGKVCVWYAKYAAIKNCGECTERISTTINTFVDSFEATHSPTDFIANKVYKNI